MGKPRHLLHVFSTFGVGGPEVRSCELINHFGERYRHTIIAMDGRYECQAKLLPGAPVTFLEVKNHRQNLLKNVQQFSRLLRQLRPDVLLTYNWGSIEWGLANSLSRVCPHLHWEEGFAPEEMVQQKKRRIYARRLFLFGLQKLIVPSRVLERIAQQIWKFAPSRVSYVPNGVDVVKYSRASSHDHNLSCIPELVKHQGSLLVGTVATLRKEKNIPRLLRVFAQATTHLDAKLVVVGGGPEYQSLWQSIQHSNLSEKVLLLGHRDDPSEIVKCFDVFAISSDTEQMPISVLEAMAAGCPVVGTDVGDIKEMVAPANITFLCPASEETAFAANLQRLLTDAPLRSSLGQQNQERCQALFDKSVMYKNYEDLYELRV
ncbi:MAG TPA: glycosyltransferase family 4 protein [Blastocatellia bacterium]|nr:glycosyltransferase family 4 protein [Blastocatellia bacterium]